MSAVRENRRVFTGDEPPPVLDPKLMPLRPPKKAVSRTGLINRLRALDESVVVVAAPAGYGKTTLLSQWIKRDARPSAWVAVDDQDNDPAVFLSYLAAGLDRALEIDPPICDVLAAPTWKSAARRLAAALLSSEEPLIVVLDDVHRLRSPDSLHVLEALAGHLPAGSTLALAGRAQPLAIARLRARGLLFELGPDELAMNSHEAHSLLRRMGAPASEEQISDLLQRTEGWPAGLYLAGLSLGAAGSSARLTGTEAFGGDHLFVTDYFRLEFLSTLTEDELSFLTRLSVIERFCRPLCAAVLDRAEVATELDQLEQSGQFIVSLDHRREWYRFHRLFRGVLRAELDRREPHIVPALNSRAADWCEAHGMAEDAVEYAYAAGETERVAKLVSGLWFSVFDKGGMTTVARWLGWLDDVHMVKRFPALAVAGAWICALTGHAAEAQAGLELAAPSSAPDGRPGRSTEIEAVVAVLRAAMCANGVDAMRADAELAIAKLNPRSPFRPTALLLLGVSHVLAGNDEDADATLTEVADQSSLPGGAVAASLALAELALLAIARNDHAEAEARGRQAREAVRETCSDGYVTAALVHCVVAHAAVRRGDLTCVRRELARAANLLPQLDYALPWLATQTRLELARLHRLIGTEAGAETLLAEVDALLRRRPRLGTLVQSVHEVRQQAVAPTAGRQASGLTSAELRLLPLLTTHLSFREIAELLFVSRNTVKTQAISVYRKLGVSSRSEAITRAADLGLVDEPAMLAPGT
jgi:LuxR family transcriptional regulator, maltose regulon positive regulatory protein